jgi:hypothetical protein
MSMPAEVVGGRKSKTRFLEGAGRCGRYSSPENRMRQMPIDSKLSSLAASAKELHNNLG